jgi:hypothetical protein
MACSIRGFSSAFIWFPFGFIGVTLKLPHGNRGIKLRTKKGVCTPFF